MHILFGLFCIIVGLINAISPKTGWYLGKGWKYKDLEPSDAALRWGRVGGVITILIGIFIGTGIIR